MNAEDRIRECYCVDGYNRTFKTREEALGFVMEGRGKKMEKRSCENCGNAYCANSVVAFYYDECVESKFTKNWKPKENKEKKGGKKMKIQEQIEKVYRVKGYNGFFHSNAEARKFARTEFAKGYMNEVKNKQEVIKSYRMELKKIKELEKEMAMYGERFAEHWKVDSYMSGQVLCSKGIAKDVKIPFDLDLSNKKDVAFAKEIIRNYCRRARTVIGQRIREYKDELKNAQKNYSIFAGGEK